MSSDIRLSEYFQEKNSLFNMYIHERFWLDSKPTASVGELLINQH